MDKKIRIAVIGDIHQDFDSLDLNYFNESNYDLILLVGDLSDLRKPADCLRVANELSKLNKLAVMIPGNHDVQNIFQFIAEIMQSSFLARLSGYRHHSFHKKLEMKLNPVVMGGYSIHPYVINDNQFDIITARPYAMGGSVLSYTPLLHHVFDVKTLEESTERLVQLVDSSVAENLLFLAHNGPRGLSYSPTGIWGCDFNPRLGDFGDQDLSDAIEYAISQGKRVLAVIAGHMHHQTYLGPKPIWQGRGVPGPIRPWIIEKKGIKYINAARVPRIKRYENQVVHHHIRLEFDESNLDISEQLVYFPIGD